MSLPLLESSFRVNPLITNLKPLRKINAIPVKTVFILSKHSQEDFSRKSENQFAKLALVALVAGVLTLGSIDPASAAKTGGLVGGQAFRSSAPRSSGPRINNSRSNVYINPPVAPLVGGYGFGVPFHGGCGCSPFPFFAPGPSVAVGTGSGFELFGLFLFLRAVSAVVRRILGSRYNDVEEY